MKQLAFPGSQRIIWPDKGRTGNNVNICLYCQASRLTIASKYWKRRNQLVCQMASMDYARFSAQYMLYFSKIYHKVKYLRTAPFSYIGCSFLCTLFNLQFCGDLFARPYSILTTYHLVISFTFTMFLFSFPANRAFQHAYKFHLGDFFFKIPFYPTVVYCSHAISCY